MSGNYGTGYGFRGGQRSLGQRPPSSVLSQSVSRVGGPRMPSYGTQNSGTNVSNMGGSRFGSNINAQGYGSSNYQSHTASGLTDKYSGAASSGIGSGNSYSGASGGNYSGMGSSGTASIGQSGRSSSAYSTTGYSSNYNTSGSDSGYNMSGTGYNTTGSSSDYYTSGSGSDYNTSGSGSNYNTSLSGSNYNRSGLDSSYNASRSGPDYSQSRAGSNYNASSVGSTYNTNRADSNNNTGGTGSNYNTGGLSSNYSTDRLGTNIPAASSTARSTADSLSLSDFIGDKRGDDSWDNVKRKYGLGGTNVDDYGPSKRPRLSSGSAPGNEFEHKEKKILMYLGNMPANVTKEKIETMFEYIPGILAYSLRRHKYNYSNACIIVEMASKEAGEKLKQTFNWMEVNGRCIVCRFCKEGEEENFIPDPDIKSDHFVYKSQTQAAEPVENKKSVYVWNLPASSRKADLEEFVSDLHYKTMNFTNGNPITGKPGHAYFDFEYDEDAERMVAELHKSLYFGSFISARIEQQKQGGDGYAPMQLGEAGDYVAQGSAVTSERPIGQIPANSSLPKRQPSKQFEDYIKGHDKTPLIGLEYITEYSAAAKNTPRYLCDLCGASPQGSSVVGHIIGFKHRLKHMEKKDPERYSRIIAMSQQKSFLSNECMKYATEVEQREGRQLISIEHNPQNVQISLPMDVMDKGKQEPVVDQNADLFSRITAYKEKIKEIENKQKEKQLSGSQTRKGQQSGQGAAKKQTDPYTEAKEALKNRLATSEEPILGLGFLRPQPDTSNPKQVPFTCQLCGSKLGHLINTMQHLTGLTHRMEYFKRRHHDLFVECEKITNRSSQRKLVEEHARELEKMDGRGTLYIDGEAFTCHPRDAGQPKVTPQPTSAPVSGSAVQQVDMVIVSDDDEDNSVGVEAQLFDRIKDMENTPLVGLRYVTETQSYNTYDPPKYKCSLCSVEVSKTFIITHMTGHQHRIEYIKKNYPELVRDAESDKDTLTNYCKDIEKDIGREYINVVKMIPPKDLNSQVTYSKPIEVKVPSANAPKPTAPEPKPEPKPEPQVEKKKVEDNVPAANITTPKPKFLMTHQEKRDHVLQERIKNRDKLPPREREAIEKQMKRDGKKEDGSVVHFYDLIEDLQNEPLLGLGSCVEVWHPKDTQPPLFHCDLCDLNTDFRQIIEHIKGAKHNYQFFKKHQPQIYGKLMKTKDNRQRFQELRTEVKRFNKTHVRETIRYTVATNDTPWRTQKQKMSLLRFVRHDAIRKQDVVPTSTAVKPGNTYADNSLANTSFQSADSGSMLADTSFQSKELQADKVKEEKGSSVADLIDASVINDEKWTEVNAEVKKRINDGRIIICKEPAKFMKTYKPFLGKFPVIGLEWLSEFQKENEDAHPWYLCRLCRSKIDWNDVVDHVVSMYHRMCFIEREHPTLHELLKESKFETGEMNEKIEEFAKGIAKPPSEQLLEVLIEKGTKQVVQSPKKDFSSMASRQVGDIPKLLDLDTGKGPHTAGSRPQPLDNRGQHIPEERREPRTPDARPPLSGNTPRKDTQAAEMTRRPSGSDIRGGAQFEERRTGLDRPGLAQKRSASESLSTADHSTNAKKARTDIPKKIPGAFARFADIYGRRAKGPLIGLNYMLEIQLIDSKKPAHYYCELCDSKLVPGSVLDHLYGFRHRQNFFTKHCPELGPPTEKKVSDYVRKHGTGRVSVARETKEEQLQKRLDAKAARMEAKAAKKAINAAKRQDKEVLERHSQGRDQQHDVESQQASSHDISDRHGHSQERIVSQSVQGNPSQSSYRPDHSLSHQPARSTQQSSVVPSAALRNIPQNQQPQLQQSKPLLQQQQMQLQQSRQLMLQQQTQMQQSGPIIQQQQPQLQQFQPLMQQQLQMQPSGPLVRQTPMLSQMTPSMNASNQMFIQRPQVVSQVNSNMVQNPQQNINMGMQNAVSNKYSQSGMLVHGPQQNIQMGIQTPNIVPASQRIMTQQPPQTFKGVCYPVPVTTANNNNSAKHTTSKTQQIQKKAADRFKYQKPLTSPTDSQKGTQFKQNQSDNSDRAEKNMSNFRIPLKNSPMKNYRQENYFDSRQKGKDTRETRESKTVGSSYKKSECQNHGSGSGSTRDDRFGSRAIDSKSKDVRGTDDRKESSRSSSSDSKQKDLSKFRSPDRRQAEENKKDIERKQKDGSLSKSPYSSRKDETKATIGSDKKRNENKSNQERKPADKLNKPTTSVKTEFEGKPGPGKDSRKDEVVGKAGVFVNKSKFVKSHQIGSYIEIKGSETKSTHSSKETNSDKTIITIDVTPFDNDLKSKQEKSETPLDKAKKVEIGSPVVSKKLNEQSKDKTKAEEKSAVTPEKAARKLNEAVISSKQARDKLSCTVTIEELKDKPKVHGKNTRVDMPECTVTVEPFTEKPKVDAKGTSIDIPEKRTKKLNETASPSKQALDKLSCSVTVDLIDIGKVNNSKSNVLKQLAETGSSPRKDSGSKQSERVTGGSSMLKTVTGVSPQKDSTMIVKSKSNVKTVTQIETSQSSELTTKQFDSSISLGQHSRKSESNHNNIATNLETEKQKWKTSVSIEDEHPDEWAVTDEWLEEEEMEVDEITSNTEKNNKEGSKASTDNTKHQSQSGIDSKSTQKEKIEKSEDIEVDIVGVKHEADKKAVHSAVANGKEMSFMKGLPTVSVTVEFDKEETHAMKSTSENSRKGTEKTVNIDEVVEDTSASKQDCIKQPEKKASLVESMEIDVTEMADQEQSDDDADFFDLSEFVTLDEEGEVDEIVVSSEEQTDSMCSSQGERDVKSKKSRRSRSRSQDRSSARHSSQSDHKSPRSDRSGSKDVGYGKSEDANADRSSRRTRSPPKGEYFKGSAAEKKKIGSMQGKSLTHKVAETKTPSGVKPVSETKTDRESNQSSIVIEEEEKKSTPKAEKPAEGFEASSRGLSKVFPSKGVSDSGSSKKATQESKADAGKATKSSVVVVSGVDKSNTEPTVVSDSSKNTTQEAKSGAVKGTKSSVVVELDAAKGKTETTVTSGSSKKTAQEGKSDAAKATKSSIVVDLGTDNSRTETTVASGSPRKATKEVKSDAVITTESSVVVELGTDNPKTKTTVAGSGVEKGSGGGESKKGKDKSTLSGAKSNECTVEIELGETPNRRSLRSNAGRKSTGLSDSKKTSDKVSPANESGKPKCEVSVSFD